MQHSDVLIQQQGSVLRITLNRPRALNSLTTPMCEAIREAVEQASPATTNAIVIDGAGERGLCGGGDIKRMVESVSAGVDFVTAEYAMDYAIHTAQVPVVGLMTGITMGGGIGLAGHASHRVVSERTTLAMPETKIGIMPDVGGHLLLGRLPGRLGELAAITSASFNAQDALAGGFADAFIAEEHHEQLISALVEGAEVEAAIQRFSSPVPQKVQPTLLPQQEWWDAICKRAESEVSRDNPVEFACHLVSLMKTSDTAANPAAYETVRRMCPVSVVVSLAQLHRTRSHNLDLAAVLDDDLRIVSRLLARSDFVEGVRALLIEKDGAPRWNPATLEEVETDEVVDLLS